MIDLHIHTKYSDETGDVLELLKKAEKKKLNYISLMHTKMLNSLAFV